MTARAATIVLVFHLAATAQTGGPDPGNLPRGPQNLSFHVGRAGTSPPGWLLRTEPQSDEGSYRATLARSGCLTGPICAMLTSPGLIHDGSTASLMQTVNAAAYRGKFIRVRAWIRRGTSNAHDTARLWIRIHRPGEPEPGGSSPDRQSQFRDAPPLDWSDCEITRQVDDDAESISFGIVMGRRGPVWIDRVSVETVREPPEKPAGETVSALIAELHRQLAADRSDEQIARSIDRWKLSERLEDRVIEELESEPTARLEGGRTDAALRALRDASRWMPPAVGILVQSPPPPSVDDQRRTINSAAEYAFRYASRLPDFMCTQTVRRSENSDGKGWKPLDVLSVQVGYFDGVEHYRLAEVNGKSAKVPYESVRGASSEGELGSMMVEIFRVGAAKFAFDHWTTLRTHPAYVFRYSVQPANSNYSLQFGLGKNQSRATVVGQNGVVYLDRDSGSVLKIVRYADGIAPDFPIEDSSTTLDYDNFEVAGTRYLLPFRAEVRLNSGGVASRNQIIFGEYRKFTGESKISFQ